MFSVSSVVIKDYKTMCVEATVRDTGEVKEYLGRLQEYAKRHKVPSKGYFVKYLNATQSENMAVQICLVVDEFFEEEGDIKQKEIVGYKGKFVTSSNVPFESIAGTYEQMHRYIAEQGYSTPSEPMWELYNKDNTAYIMWPVRT